MKKALFLLFSLLLTACATQPTGPYSHLSDDELTAQIRVANQARPIPFCETLAPLSGEIFNRDPTNIENRNAKNYADFRCAYRERRWKEAYASMLLTEEGGWSHREFGLYTAYAAEEHEDTLKRIEIMAMDIESTPLLNVEPEMFWRFYQNLSFANRENLKKPFVKAITNSPYFQLFDIAFRSSIASEKLRQDAESGMFDEADKWVAELASAPLFTPMLADKRFEPIWPLLEQAAGPNFTHVSMKQVQATLDRYGRNNSDLDAHKSATHALLFAGKFEEVIGFVNTPTEAEFSSITEDEAWALNAKVYALDALGLRDDGTKIFESLATIPVNDSNKRWLINFTINRAARLVGYGNWQQGYKAATYAENFSGSPYAKMLIRKYKACALLGSGDTQAASVLLDEIYENRQDSYFVAAEAMLCGRREHAAAEIILEAFEDDEHRGRILETLQKPEFLFFPVGSELPQLHSLLSTSPSVKAAFEEKGRLIPDEFMPIAGTRRHSEQ